MGRTLKDQRDVKAKRIPRHDPDRRPPDKGGQRNAIRDAVDEGYEGPEVLVPWESSDDS